MLSLQLGCIRLQTAVSYWQSLVPALALSLPTACQTMVWSIVSRYTAVHYYLVSGHAPRRGCASAEGLRACMVFSLLMLTQAGNERVYTLIQFSLFAAIRSSPHLYSSFGFGAELGTPAIVSLLLFLLVISPVDEVLSFLLNIVSRAFEFQADAFAAGLGYGKELRAALLRLVPGKVWMKHKRDPCRGKACAHCFQGFLHNNGSNYSPTRHCGCAGCPKKTRARYMWTLGIPPCTTPTLRLCNGLGPLMPTWIKRSDFNSKPRCAFMSFDWESQLTTLEVFCLGRTERGEFCFTGQAAGNVCHWHAFVYNRRTGLHGLYRTLKQIFCVQENDYNENMKAMKDCCTVFTSNEKD
eukprot:1142421-Pelagomonas_calceolata.AAC.2